MGTLDAQLTREIDAVFPEEEYAEARSISLIDSLAILRQNWRWIGGVTASAALIAAIVVCLLPESFQASAVIMPPQQQQPSLASLATGALGGLAASGMASSLGLKNPADLYIGILQSRTVADDIVNHFHLKDVYAEKRDSDTRQALAKHVSFSSGKDSLITITFEDRDPKRAAGVANAFVDELHSANSRLALTDASQRRLFFERELAKEKDALADAEVALKQNQKKSGLIIPAGQAELLLRSGAQLRAEIASREVQIESMRSYAAEENPQLQLLKREAQALRGQLAQLQSKSDGSGFEMSTGQLPDASLEYLRRMRDVKFHEALFELLSRQYEAARIDEARQSPVIQIVDRAIIPDKKSWPPRLILIFTAGILSMIITSLMAVVKQRCRDSGSGGGGFDGQSIMHPPA